ncbi:hypothetical protein LIER_40876 [Lithospermum erythrorhizon]|uniref:Reverse transcriptase Ty1/copia-type domain-containing protein n=1 Tax=Lithospermum erythrorhizon TaxID=34254 RepID=A0AAV3R0Z3_LITER
MSLRPHPKPSLKKLANHPRALAVTTTETEPKCFTQANKCPLWRKAMSEEINAMMLSFKWSVLQIDIQNAFLHGTVYMVASGLCG